LDAVDIVGAMEIDRDFYSIVSTLSTIFEGYTIQTLANGCKQWLIREIRS